MLLVGGLALLWEFAEFFADLILDTNLSPSLGDSVRDILFGGVGAGVGVGAAWWLAHVGRTRQTDPGSR